MTVLNKTECSALRGIAILGIVLHNYCHWLGMAVKENEYTFTQANADGILNAVLNPSWNLPIHLLSFFGHYGVPVFLFLSAYGLTKKYETLRYETLALRRSSSAGLQGKNASLRKQLTTHNSSLSFLWKHFKKLWWMMIVGFAGFLMVDRIVESPHHYHLIDIVSQLLLVNNLLPDPDHIIWPGPYWFFGLMMQLYIVYRLVLYKRHWGFTVALMVICFLLQCFCDPQGETLNRLRYNFIGGMLPFGMGLLYARYERELKRWQYALLAAVSLLLICAWSMEYQAWYWVPAMVCVFSIALVKIMPRNINELLAWVGGISSAMFVCHPITRKIFISISRHGDLYTGLLMYIVATFILSIIFKHLMKMVKS